jgi:formate dehydrogenase assembly factor FdhD
MPSQETKWYKDARLIQALDEIRQRNQAFMSYCHYCGAKSIDIKAVKEKLYPVCQEHQDSEDLSDWMEASKGRHDINRLLESQSSFEE